MDGGDRGGHEPDAHTFQKSALAPRSACDTKIEAASFRGIPARHELLTWRVRVQRPGDVVRRAEREDRERNRLACEQPRGGRDSAVSSRGDNKLRSFVDQLSERRFSIEDACELVARRFDELADP